MFIGNQINASGLTPKFREVLRELSVQSLPPMLRELYAAVSPDGPDHFDEVFGKLAETWKVAPDLALSELEAVRAPALVIAADDDVVTIEHVDAIRRAIPSAQLAIVPGASHGLPMEKPALLARLIHDFLPA